MGIMIKKMETDSEIKGKAYVHWKAWQEAYTGLVSQSYLDDFSLEKSTDLAYRCPDHILVAKDNDKVVGFVKYGAYRESPIPDTGEIHAIYILKEYYDKKVGYALMRAAIDQLSQYGQIAVWVLEGNNRAIRFYERYGFQFDGTEKQIMLGAEMTELRMKFLKKE